MLLMPCGSCHVGQYYSYVGQGYSCGSCHVGQGYSLGSRLLIRVKVTHVGQGYSCHVGHVMWVKVLMFKLWEYLIPYLICLPPGASLSPTITLLLARFNVFCSHHVNLPKLGTPIVGNGPYRIKGGGGFP